MATERRTLHRLAELALLAVLCVSAPAAAQQTVADMRIVLGLGSSDGTFGYTIAPGGDVVVEVGVVAREGFVAVTPLGIQQFSGLFPDGSAFPSDDLFGNDGTLRLRAAAGIGFESESLPAHPDTTPHIRTRLTTRVRLSRLAVPSVRFRNLPEGATTF